MSNKAINVLALVKGEEQYLFLFDDSNRTETLRMLGRYAANPELSFTWYDAAILSQKIRDTLPACEIEMPAISTSRTTARFHLPAPGERS